MKNEPILTVGIMREALGSYPAIAKFLAGRKNNEIIEPYDLLLRSDYIAAKLWEREDIRLELCERGYKGLEEEIDEVLNINRLDKLGDCTDHDWEIIANALDEAGFE